MSFDSTFDAAPPTPMIPPTSLFSHYELRWCSILHLRRTRPLYYREKEERVRTCRHATVTSTGRVRRPCHFPPLSFLQAIRPCPPIQISSVHNLKQRLLIALLLPLGHNPLPGDRIPIKVPVFVIVSPFEEFEQRGAKSGVHSARRWSVPFIVSA